MIIGCGRCRRKYFKTQLKYKQGKMLCPKCIHDWRKYHDQKLDSAPSILKRTLTPKGEVVEVGKDVPFGYQDDPDVIDEKLNQEKKDKLQRHIMGELNNKEFWAKYNANSSFRKMVDSKWMDVYRTLGVKILKAKGYPDYVIKSLIKGVNKNGK